MGQNGLGKIEYTIIGRVSFVDSEGDPAQKDYLLFHLSLGLGDRVLGYGYYVTKKSRLIPPKEAFTGTGVITMADGSTWKFSERETYTIDQVDGSLPYITEVGEQVEIAEFKNVNTRQFRETLPLNTPKV